MNRGLLIALALVAGLSVYAMNSQGDDELLAPSKQGDGASKRPSRASSASSPDDGIHAEQGRRRAPSAAHAAAMEPWMADALTQGVNQWQDRLRPPADGQDAAGKGRSAWAGMQPPPPPPPVRTAAPEQDLPPPPPMAPRFPHAWVGRFDDETAQRAVLAGPQGTWVVRAGDVIEGQWRIDRIQERSMSLTYLPLKQQQTLAMR